MIGFDGHDLVRRHFAGEGSPFDQRRLFRHLRRCDRCRGEYRTCATLEALERDGETRARERMARSIFAPPRRTAKTFMGIGFGVLAMAGVALVARVSADRASDGFQARGAAKGTEAPQVGPALELFRLRPDGQSERVGSNIRADEALAFSFVNPGDRGGSHLMVFARDAVGAVFWFWPAHEDPTGNPQSLPIPRTEQPIELGEAVRHQLRPGPLTVFALFSDRPHHVRQVEAALAAGPSGLTPLGGVVWTETLEVLP